MTYAKWAMLAVVALALLASACAGSQRSASPTVSQTPEQQAVRQAPIIGINFAGGPLPLIDLLAGVVVGNVDSGYTPEVLLRRKSGQLLVSQAFGPGPAQADESSLAVFDLDDLSSPSAIIPMPGRPSFTGYARSAVLSRDEHYLYYPQATSICPEGGDGAVCTEWSIGVIDLQAERQVAQAEIGLVGCIPKIHVEPGAEQTVLVTCGSAGRTLVEFTPDAVRFLRIGPDGAATALGAFPGRRTANWIKSVLFAGQRADGTYFAVYNDGAVFDAGGDEAIIDLLPEEDWEFGFNTGAMLGSDRYLLAFGARFNPAILGVVVLNAAAPEDVRTFDLPFAFQHVAPLDERRVALLHGDGLEVSVLDVETGSVSNAMTLPERVGWLSGG